MTHVLLRCQRIGRTMESQEYYAQCDNLIRIEKHASKRMLIEDAEQKIMSKGSVIRKGSIKLKVDKLVFNILS